MNMSAAMRERMACVNSNKIQSFDSHLVDIAHHEIGHWSYFVCRNTIKWIETITPFSHSWSSRLVFPTRDCRCRLACLAWWRSSLIQEWDVEAVKRQLVHGAEAERRIIALEAELPSSMMAAGAEVAATPTLTQGGRGLFDTSSWEAQTLQRR